MPTPNYPGTPTIAQASENTEHALHSTLSDLRDKAPAMLDRAKSRVEDLTQRTIERARDAGYHMRDRAVHAGDMTVGYIRDEPMKSVLIAAATGAAVAMLIGWLVRSSSYSRRH